MGSRIWNAIKTSTELEQLIQLYHEESYLLTFQERRIIHVVCKTNLKVRPKYTYHTILNGKLSESHSQLMKCVLFIMQFFFLKLLKKK
jgi:hypothetical protein